MEDLRQLHIATGLVNGHSNVKKKISWMGDIYSHLDIVDPEDLDERVLVLLGELSWGER